MPSRYILVAHSRPSKEVEAYLYTHTKVIGHLKPGRMTFTLLETTAGENVDYFATYQADRLASAPFGTQVFDTYEEAASAMVDRAGRFRD